MSMSKQVRVGRLVVVALALSAIVMFGWGHPQAGTSQAGAVTGGALAVDCDAAQGGIQSNCTYAPGSTFNVEIHVTELPTPTGGPGYQAVQVKLEWVAGVLNYLPTASPGDEALWPDCDIAARTDNQPLPPDGLGKPSLVLACQPFAIAIFTDMGAIMTFQLQCKGTPEAMSPPAGLDPNQSSLSFIPHDADPDNQLGTHFTDTSQAPIKPGPAFAGATVTCGEVPELPPTDGEPTATPQPEPGVSLTGGETVIEVGGSTVLTFTVVDDLGNTVGEGEVCTFSVVGDATLSSETGTTDANGDVSVTLTAGTTAETVQVTADCGDFGSFVQDVTISPALPVTGAALGADSGFSVGLWAMIGALLVAAAAGLTVYGWRSTRAR